VKKASIFAVRCPVHPSQEIGAIKRYWSAEIGFWCRKCKGYKFFNEENIKIPLTFYKNCRKVLNNEKLSGERA